MRLARINHIGGEGYGTFGEWAAAENVIRNEAEEALAGARPDSLVCSGWPGSLGLPLNLFQHVKTPDHTYEPQGTSVDILGGVQVCDAGGTARKFGAVTIYSDITFSVVGRARPNNCVSWTVDDGPDATLDTWDDWPDSITLSITSNKECALTGELLVAFYTSDPDDEIAGVTVTPGEGTTDGGWRQQYISFFKRDKYGVGHDLSGTYWCRVLTIEGLTEDGQTKATGTMSFRSPWASPPGLIVYMAEPATPVHVVTSFASLAAVSCETTAALSPTGSCFSCSEGTAWELDGPYGSAGHIVIAPVWADEYYEDAGHTHTATKYTQRMGAIAVMWPPRAIYWRDDAHFSPLYGEESTNGERPCYGSASPDMACIPLQADTTELAERDIPSEQNYNSANPNYDYLPLFPGADALTFGVPPQSGPWQHTFRCVSRITAYRCPSVPITEEIVVSIGCWTTDEDPLDTFTEIDSVTIEANAASKTKDVRIPMFPQGDFAWPFPNSAGDRSKVFVQTNSEKALVSLLICCAVDMGDNRDQVWLDDESVSHPAAFRLVEDHECRRGMHEWVRIDTDALSHAAGI